MKTKKFIVFFLFLCMILTGPILVNGVQAQEAEGAETGDVTDTETGEKGLTQTTDENDIIYENLNYWIAFVGPDAPEVMTDFPDFIGIRAKDPDGRDTLFGVNVAKQRGDLQTDEPGQYYYKPYIARRIEENDGDKRYVAFNIRGKVPNTVTDKNGVNWTLQLGKPVIEGKQVENIPSNSVIYMPYEDDYTFKHEVKDKTYTFNRTSGGSINLEKGEKGEKEEVEVLSAYVQVYQPKLDVRFVDGTPENITVKAISYGSYYRENANENGEEYVIFPLENKEKDNTHDLYQIMMSMKETEGREGRAKVNYFRMPALNTSYQSTRLLRYDLQIPDLDNFTKQVTQEGTHENGYHWKVTYTAKKVDKEYTLTFDLAGGMYNGQTGTYYIKAKDGDTITLPAPTREGHTFSHWQGSKYYAGESYTVTEDHAFVAVWEEDPIPTNTSDSLPKVVIPIVTSTEPSVTVPQASVARDDISKLPSTGQSSGMSVAGAGLLILASTVFAVNNILSKKKGHK